MLYLLQLLLSAAFALLTIQRKSLTISGAVSAVLMGNAVIFFSGYHALIPLLIFFAGSQLISRAGFGKKTVSDLKSEKPRDALQVFSNGGVYLGCSLLEYLTGDLKYQTAMLISIGIATADTWSSEVGSRVRGTTYLFPTCKKTTAGISGGVSMSGTLAGLAGAAIIAFFGQLPLGDLQSFAIITIAGTTGMFLDSLIGHYFQIKYLDTAAEEWRDHAIRYRATKGYRVITNDVVNLSSNFVVTLFFLLVA